MFSDRANMVSLCIRRLNETGVVVTNTVCDNPTVNLSMLAHLGAKVHWNNPQPCLNIGNLLGKPILCFLDPPHCQKLTRNTFGDLGVLIDGNGGEVKWAHVQLLHELQTLEGLTLANKLKREHILYYKNKMKVRLATEVLSQSVATALIFCEHDLKRPQFHGASVTAEYLSCFDILFDLMNSKYICGKRNKSLMILSSY